VDFSPVLLDEHCHGHDQGSSDVFEDAASGFYHEWAPGWPVLEVVGFGQARRDVHEGFADLLRSNTREFGSNVWTSALVVVLPEPWVPLIQTITIRL
jgi:hypothetical protein